MAAGEEAASQGRALRQLRVVPRDPGRPTDARYPERRGPAAYQLVSRVWFGRVGRIPASNK